MPCLSMFAFVEIFVFVNINVSAIVSKVETKNSLPILIANRQLFFSLTSQSTFFFHVWIDCLMI